MAGRNRAFSSPFPCPDDFQHVTHARVCSGCYTSFSILIRGLCSVASAALQLCETCEKVKRLADEEVQEELARLEGASATQREVGTDSWSVPSLVKYGRQHFTPLGFPRILEAFQQQQQRLQEALGQTEDAHTTLTAPRVYVCSPLEKKKKKKQKNKKQIRPVLELLEPLAMSGSPCSLAAELAGGGAPSPAAGCCKRQVWSRG